ncbi:MAG: LCP family protein [Patescibacteria group bacterium]|nr:LCP family protein [Patescibacteria group bacterium]
MIDFKQKLEENEPDVYQQKQLQRDEEILEKFKKHRKIKNYLIALLVLAIVFSGKVIMSSSGASQWLSNNPIINLVSHLGQSADNQLQGEEQDRVNILLLGMGGENHDGGYLADTIMMLSLQPSTKKVAMISIPRDLTVPTENGYWRKVNSIHAIAEAKEEGQGGPAMINSLTAILDQKIDYYIRIDFDGFIKVIDELGGIDVNVENNLDDYSYPIRGEEDNENYFARFEHLHIEKGQQHMNGSLALKYARSRHAGGAEGSDFARAKRQQLILEAFKDKLLSKNNLLKPGMLSRIITELNRNIKTNLDAWALLKIWNDYKDVQRDQITNTVLSDGPGGFLISSRGDDGAYILIPQTGNFNNIQVMIKNIFGVDEKKLDDVSTNNKVQENKETPVIGIEKVNKEIKVAVLNGTWISGLAANSALNLQNYGFKIIETANAPTREYSDSVIYDLSYGKELKSLEILQAAANAKLVYDAPSWLETYKNSPEHPDFILIVGTTENN